MILLTISILALVYWIMGKDVNPLLERVKSVNWRSKMGEIRDKLQPWALKVGRVAARPLVAFYYVMADEKTSTLDRVLIYAAIAYTIVPMDLLPRSVFKLLGVLDDGAAILYVYRKIKDRVTPRIKAAVEDTLNEWFGVEYVVVKRTNNM